MDSEEEEDSHRSYLHLPSPAYFAHINLPSNNFLPSYHPLSPLPPYSSTSATSYFPRTPSSDSLNTSNMDNNIPNAPLSAPKATAIKFNEPSIPKDTDDPHHDHDLDQKPTAYTTSTSTTTGANFYRSRGSSLSSSHHRPENVGGVFNPRSIISRGKRPADSRSSHDGAASNAHSHLDIEEGDDWRGGEHKKKQVFKGRTLLWLAYQSIGVIYGDIGTRLVLSRFIPPFFSFASCPWLWLWL